MTQLLHGEGGGKTIGLLDTFTDVDGTLISAHDPNIILPGKSYSSLLAGEIQNNRYTCVDASTLSLDRVDFGMQQVGYETDLFMLDEGVAMMIRLNSGGGGSSDGHYTRFSRGKVADSEDHILEVTAAGPPTSYISLEEYDWTQPFHVQFDVDRVANIGRLVIAPTGRDPISISRQLEASAGDFLTLSSTGQAGGPYTAELDYLKVFI